MPEEKPWEVSQAETKIQPKPSKLDLLRAMVAGLMVGGEEASPMVVPPPPQEPIDAQAEEIKRRNAKFAILGGQRPAQ